MSAAGPELPPHLLAKRKRQAEEEEAAKSASKNEENRSSSPESGEKRRRVVGPAPPPAPLGEIPSSRLEEDGDSSSSDDDFGPAPPPKDAPFTAYSEASAFANMLNYTDSGQPEKRSERDEWMMMPPTQDDLAARMDPTKLRARKFNTGKGAKGPAGGSSGNNIWTETPEQKRKRLENEVLGIVPLASEGGGDSGRSKSKLKDDETARRIKEYHEKVRGPSLFQQHSSRSDREKEDDPSQRGFDWEKDMKAGSKIGHAQRKEMVNRASNLGSKFSGGGFL